MAKESHSGSRGCDRPVSRRDLERLDDIHAVTAIRRHVAYGNLSDGLIFDAVRVRLIEIGEAIKALPAERADAGGLDYLRPRQPEAPDTGRRGARQRSSGAVVDRSDDPP